MSKKPASYISYINKLKENEATSKAYDRWTPEEDIDVVKHAKEGLHIEAIAKLHKRTIGSIRARLYRVIKEDELIIPTTIIAINLQGYKAFHDDNARYNRVIKDKSSKVNSRPTAASRSKYLQSVCVKDRVIIQYDVGGVLVDAYFPKSNEVIQFSPLSDDMIKIVKDELSCDIIFYDLTEESFMKCLTHLMYRLISYFLVCRLMRLSKGILYIKIESSLYVSFRQDNVYYKIR